ncbi:MAG: hypothetical protein O3C57_03820, partial [Verrucomicrobia bacterium]|nr:hypothetical protein [Verrucomicrobiota bacterium]
MSRTPVYPLPHRRNLVIAGLQLAALLSILVGTAYLSSWWAVLLLALAYGIVMNSAYAMMHEAEHNLFHPNARINHTAGAVIGLFF